MPVCIAYGRRLLRALLVPMLVSMIPTGLLAESSPERSVRLNNYGNWGYRSDTISSKSALLKMVASRENICFTEYWGVTPKEIRSLNPDAKVYQIYDLCCKNRWDPDWNDASNTSRMQTPLSRQLIAENDWWLRDGDGKIVKEHDDTWFLDVGKPGFREAFLQNMLTRLNGKGFDGVVLDYWWSDMISPWFARRSLTPPGKYPTDDDWFSKAWMPFIDYITRGLHDAGYRVIGNCVGEYGTSNQRLVWQRSKVDGVIYEQWAVDWPNRGSKWLDGKRIESRIRAMSLDPLEVWVTDGGLLESDPELDRKRLVSLAMYYIAMPSSQKNRSYHYCRSRKVFWDDLWDINIGIPTGVAVRRPDDLFWSREFTKGLVLLNYDASKEVTYLLKREYRDSDGKVVSGSISVPPHTGLILTVDK